VAGSEFNFDLSRTAGCLGLSQQMCAGCIVVKYVFIRYLYCITVHLDTVFEHSMVS